MTPILPEDPEEQALVAFLQAYAPLPPLPAPQLEDQILAQIADFEVQGDQALVAFLTTHVPQPPSAPAYLEDQILAALAQDQDSDAGLIAFLQAHAPQPPVSAGDLEDRIMTALIPHKRRSIPAWWGGIAAAGMIVGVFLGTQYWLPIQQATIPPIERDLVLDLGDTGIFAEDTETGLYDVRL